MTVTETERYGEDLTGDKEMFQFRLGNPFAKVKKEMQEGMYKRMATDAEEDDRLKAQKKACSTFQKDGKTGKRNRPEAQGSGRKRIQS